MNKHELPNAGKVLDTLTFADIQDRLRATLRAVVDTTSLEQEPQRPPVAVIFHDNHVFGAHVGLITDTLRELGRDVRVIAWQTDEHRQALEQNLIAQSSEPMQMDLLVDDTTSTLLHGTPLTHEPLDVLFDEAVTLTTLGITDPTEITTHSGNLREMAKDIDATKRVFQTIIKNILEQTRELPHRVLITLDKLFQHEPFNQNAEVKNHRSTLSAELRKQLTAVKGNDLLENEALQNFHSRLNTFFPSEELRESVAMQLTQWLTECGISEKNIEIQPQISEAKVEELDTPHTWIIGDRHAVENMPISNTAILELPIASLYESAVEQGLLLPDHAIDAVLDILVRQRFE